MGEENAKLVRRIYEAWGRGDFSKVDWVHPEIEFIVPDGHRHHGLEGMREAWRDWLETWSEWRAELEELIVVDEKRILTVSRFSGKGAASGIAAEAFPGTALFTFEEGRVKTLKLAAKPADVMRELGLG